MVFVFISGGLSFNYLVCVRVRIHFLTENVLIYQFTLCFACTMKTSHDLNLNGAISIANKHMLLF